MCLFRNKRTCCLISQKSEKQNDRENYINLVLNFKTEMSILKQE